jgi:hypothetical protein
MIINIRQLAILKFYQTRKLNSTYQPLPGVSRIKEPDSSLLCLCLCSPGVPLRCVITRNSCTPAKPVTNRNLFIFFLPALLFPCAANARSYDPHSGVKIKVTGNKTAAAWVVAVWFYGI